MQQNHQWVKVPSWSSSRWAQARCCKHHAPSLVLNATCVFADYAHASLNARLHGFEPWSVVSRSHAVLDPLPMVHRFHWLILQIHGLQPEWTPDASGVYSDSNTLACLSSWNQLARSTLVKSCFILYDCPPRACPIADCCAILLISVVLIFVFWTRRRSGRRGK